MNKLRYYYWMYKALHLSKMAWYHNEIPVGALLIYRNKILTETWNCNKKYNDIKAHAEMLALNVINNINFNNLELYVTKEPCLMCLKNIIKNKKIKHVIYGANNTNYQTINIFLKKINIFNIKLNIKFTNGILVNECSKILKKFFFIRRIQNKSNKL